MSTDPFKLGCHCGFLTTDPQAFLDHCLTTQHIEIEPGAETGALEELTQMFATLQRFDPTSDQELPEGMEINPVSEDDILNDDELTDEEKAEILARFAAFDDDKKGE